MPFSLDRDLLAYEPNLFDEVSFGTQMRVNVSDGVVSATTLTSAAADFEAAQVAPGSVALVNGVACEVISRDDANTLTISLPRAGADDDPIPPGDGAALPVIVRTFANQAAIVYELLLHQLGIDAHDAAPGSAAEAEAAILSLDLMRRLETLGTLARIYTGAVAIGADNADALAKAKDYHMRFDAACSAAVIDFDHDGDGAPDRQVFLGLVRWVRV